MNAGRGVDHSAELVWRLADRGPALIRVLTPDGGVADVNRAWTAFTGVAREHLLGEGWVALVHPDDLGEYRRRQTVAAAARAPFRARYRVRCGDEYRSVLEQARPVFSADGDFRGHVAAGLEVTARRLAREARRRREDPYRRYFESSPIGAGFNDPVTGRLLQVNEALAAMLGYSRQELLGLGVKDLTHPDDWEATLAAWRMMMSGEQGSYALEKRYRRRDGTTIWVRVDATLVRGDGGRPLYTVAVIRDVSDRRKTVEALRASQERYRSVVDSQTDLICRYRSDTTLTFVNDAYCRFFARPRGELIGTRFIDLVPPHARDAVHAHVAALVAEPASQPPRATEHEVVRPDGTVGWQHWIDQVIRDADGNVVELQGIGRDVTERKRAEIALREREEELRRSRDAIRTLAGSLITAQEEERRRISRELHDDLGQKVAAIAIGISRLRHRQPRAAAPLRRELARLQRRAVAVADDIRRVSHELHPPVLEQAGLVVAITSHCTEFTNYTGIEIVLELTADVGDLDRDVALVLFRVTQEALRNIAKHAEASVVHIGLRRRTEALELSVRDFGKGIDAGGGHEGGLGLVSMAERVRLIGATLAVRRAPRGGTEVVVSVPLRER
jgi:PAS domain S-box-containing protein